jgi:hypothetical protein
MKSLNTPNFSWGFFNFGLVDAPALSPVVTPFPSRREGREISKQRGTCCFDVG